MDERVLVDLKEAAAGVAAARVTLVAAIQRARKAGMTLRDIGEATGLAHETIRRLASSS